MHFSLYLFASELDNEGVIEPDTDEPQPMGDTSAEVCTTDLLYYNIVGLLWD